MSLLKCALVFENQNVIHCVNAAIYDLTVSLFEIELANC